MKPIFLYVKTHNKTGLKYFGQTTSADPHRYRGSGTRWINHIRVHGYDVTTEIVGKFVDRAACLAIAVEFSSTHNIVESNEWANLKIETLEGGFDHIHRLPSEIKKQWMREWWEELSDEEQIRIISTRSHPGESNYWFGSSRTGAQNPRYGAEVSDSTKEKIRKTKLNKMIVKHALTGEVVGLVVIDHPKVSSGEWVPVNTGRTHSEETKKKMQAVHKASGRIPPSPKGLLWWTNGVINVRAKEKPGDDYVRGRTKL